MNLIECSVEIDNLELLENALKDFTGKNNLQLDEHGDIILKAEQGAVLPKNFTYVSSNFFTWCYANLPEDAFSKHDAALGLYFFDWANLESDAGMPEMPKTQSAFTGLKQAAKGIKVAIGW